MKSMKTWMAGLACVMAVGMASGTAAASESNVKWDKAPVDVSNQASLQRGARLFVNYCQNCHSAAFMRYTRLQDIGLTEQQIKDNLLLTDRKIGETMVAAITPAQGKAWFGNNPPDLTLVARSRAGSGGSGADYLYTYLRSFYRDADSPTGWNNTTFPNVGMPHAMWELQGERRPVFETHTVDGKEERVFSGKWEQVTAGTMSTQEFDQSIGDLVNFMQWMAEPMQNSRKKIGWAVMAFLTVFAFCAWNLNKAFWKDVK